MILAASIGGACHDELAPLHGAYIASKPLTAMQIQERQFADKCDMVAGLIAKFPRTENAIIETTGWTFSCVHRVLMRLQGQQRIARELPDRRTGRREWVYRSAA